MLLLLLIYPVSEAIFLLEARDCHVEVWLELLGRFGKCNEADERSKEPLGNTMSLDANALDYRFVGRSLPQGQVQVVQEWAHKKNGDAMALGWTAYLARLARRGTLGPTEIAGARPWRTGVKIWAYAA